MVDALSKHAHETYMLFLSIFGALAVNFETHMDRGGCMNCQGSAGVQPGPEFFWFVLVLRAQSHAQIWLC